jgi:hypothetical protein
MAPRHRKAADYARRAPAREPYDRVLIVCEGEKTEPQYFNGLRLAERLSSANIRVTPADGSDPLSIVRFAERLANEYDRTYCVFDRDGHANYDDALQRVAQSALGRSQQLIAVPSWPCFELWMLLHFRYSTAAIVAGGGRSSGENACRELRNYMADYQKGRVDVYRELSSRQAAALKNAGRLERDNAGTGNHNPSTRVHGLVSYLLHLREQV